MRKATSRDILVYSWHCAYLSLWHNCNVQHSDDGLNQRHDDELEGLLELELHVHREASPSNNHQATENHGTQKAQGHELVPERIQVQQGHDHVPGRLQVTVPSARTPWMLSCEILCTPGTSESKSLNTSNIRFSICGTGASRICTRTWSPIICSTECRSTLSCCRPSTRDGGRPPPTTSESSDTA